MKKEISIVVFWGSLWGIFEATVGYLLHALDFPFSSLVWFPAAYYFMNRVYKQTGKVYSIFLTSCVAAIIKLVDFLLPVRIDRVLNPFASIILEGLAVFAVFTILEHRKECIFKFDIVKVFTVSLGWRILYLLYLLPLPDSFVKVSPLRGVEPLLKFLLFNGIIGGIVIYAFIKTACLYRYFKMKNIKELHVASVNKVSGLLERINFNPLISFTLLLFAMFVQWMMK